MGTTFKIPKDVLISTPANCSPTFKNLINQLNQSLNNGTWEWSSLHGIYNPVGNKIKMVEAIEGKDDETMASGSGLFDVSDKIIYLLHFIRFYRSPDFGAGSHPTPICWMNDRLSQQDIPIWGNQSIVYSNVLDVFGMVELRDVHFNGLEVNPVNTPVQIDYSGLKITLDEPK
jgi:hypothetical protein